MGDPKKIRKQYAGPSHPWNKERIDDEKSLIKEYGLRNKKEVWKMQYFLTRAKDRAKILSREQSDQGAIEREQLLSRLQSLGILGDDASLSTVLALDVRDIMERRLQTQVHKQMLSNSAKQARQYITHGHVLVKGKKITSPGYLLTLEEASQVTFDDTSTLNDPEHPERAVAKKETAEEKEASAKAKDAAKAPQEQAPEEKDEKPAEEPAKVAEKA